MTILIEPRFVVGARSDDAIERPSSGTTLRVNLPIESKARSEPATKSLTVLDANLKLISGHAHQPERICTWNVESNEDMIRVNEEIGFEVAGMAFNWQKTAR